MNVLEVECERRPCVDMGARGKLETGWHHANHSECLGIELNRLSHNRAISSERALPEPVADDDYSIGAEHRLFGCESSTKCGTGFQHREEFRCRPHTRHAQGIARTGKREIHLSVGSERLERSRLVLPVLVSGD